MTLEDGYASLSREALQKLLPLMEEGMRFAPKDPASTATTPGEWSCATSAACHGGRLSFA